MSRITSRPKLSEKGLLDNCVVTLLDLQPQMLFRVGHYDRQAIISNNLVLAKAVRAFGAPVVLTTGDASLQWLHLATGARRVPGAGADRALDYERVGRCAVRRSCQAA